MEISPRIYEILISGMLIIIGYFMRRVLSAMDAMREEVKGIRLDLAQNYVSKQEHDDDIEDHEARIMVQMELCKARHDRRSTIKEAV